MGWIRLRMDPKFCLDPDLELGNFKAGSESESYHK